MALKLVGEDAETPPPPRKLGKFGTQLWQSVTRSYCIEDAGGIELLCGACQQLDRAESCRTIIDRDGELLKSKTGMREHPLLKAELASRAYVARCIQRLGLDVEALRAGPGRPPMFG